MRARSPLWQRRIGLSHFSIRHSFVDAFFGDEDAGDVKTTAVTNVRWQYLEARIVWYLPSAVRHEDEYLERTLVHELCHVLLSPEQADIPGKHSEKLELSTEMVARALWIAWSPPMGVIEVEEHLTDEQAEAIRRRWMDLHG